MKDLLDLQRVIGSHYSNLLVPGPPDQQGDATEMLDMEAAWRYIVDHRMSLKLLGAGVFFLYVISYVNNIKMIKKMRFSYVN